MFRKSLSGAGRDYRLVLMGQGQITALAVSAHAPKVLGALRCVQVHQKVINLLSADQQLITLHRFGCGLSPMGWCLSPPDFDQIRQQAAILTYQYTVQGLQIGRKTCVARRHLTLTLPTGLPDLALIEQILSRLSVQTGLFGALNQLLLNELPPVLSQLKSEFIQLLNYKYYDFQLLIGLGPGLTPSLDDMIVAILAVLYSDPNLAELLKKKPNLFNLNLDQLTTCVSAAFLQHAAQGVFATPLLSLMRMLQKRQITPNTLHQFLRYGHTSGADSLLGLWIGRTIVDDFYADKRKAVC